MSDKHKITWLEECSVMTEDYPKPDPLFSKVYSMDLSQIKNTPGQTIVGRNNKDIEIERLEKENEKLKDLLKECQTTLAGYEDLYGNIYTKNLLPTRILTQIDEVLK